MHSIRVLFTKSVGSQVLRLSSQGNNAHACSNLLPLVLVLSHPVSLWPMRLCATLYNRGISSAITRSPPPNTIHNPPTPSHPPRPKPLALSSINNSTKNKLSSQPCPVSSTISLASSLVIPCLPSRRRLSLQSTNNRGISQPSLFSST